ncbi:MAG: F0F1 ATP synthase subunit B [Bacilli bacterium]|nr:F0F1 ATP synthase subunit B [Bacilli bacterium]
MRNTRKALWILLPLTAAALSSCQGAPFQEQDFVKKIFPNGMWDFLIQLVAFILLLLIVFFLGYKPIHKMMQKRRDAVNGMIEDAKKNQVIAEKAAKASDQTILEGKEEAERILAEARKQAQFEREKLLADTEQEIIARKKKADEDILAAQEASKEEVRRQIVDVAMLASETLLSREVDDADNRRLVESFVDDLNGGDGDK